MFTETEGKIEAIRLACQINSTLDHGEKLDATDILKASGQIYAWLIGEAEPKQQIKLPAPKNNGAEILYALITKGSCIGTSFGAIDYRKRISELRTIHGLKIDSVATRVENKHGKKVTCATYKLVSGNSEAFSVYTKINK